MAIMQNDFNVLDLESPSKRRSAVGVNGPKFDSKKTIVINNAQEGNVEPLLKRAFMFLDDEKFDIADEYCGRVLDQDPENAYAYLGKLMVIVPKQKFNKAMSLLDFGDCDSAYALLEEIGNNEVIAQSKYDRAISFIDAGNYETAYMLLNGLSYKDSDDKLQSTRQILLQKANVGDMVFFGLYEQDDNTSNGKEDIEWRVLAKEYNRILVISDKALDCQPYDTDDCNHWEFCSLREWANDMFFYDAFNIEEQAQIQSTTIYTEGRDTYGTTSGDSTMDKVFLLNITEVKKYFSSEEDKLCIPTEYAIAQGAWTAEHTDWRVKPKKDGKATCMWWLRSPVYDQDKASYVYVEGNVHCPGTHIYDNVTSRGGGGDVNDDELCVCPAMWISLK